MRRRCKDAILRQNAMKRSKMMAIREKPHKIIFFQVMIGILSGICYNDNNDAEVREEGQKWLDL